MFLEPFQLFFLVDIHCFLAPQPRWDVLFTTFNTVPFLEDRNEIAKKKFTVDKLSIFPLYSNTTWPPEDLEQLLQDAAAQQRSSTEGVPGMA